LCVPCCLLKLKMDHYIGKNLGQHDDCDDDENLVTSLSKRFEHMQECSSTSWDVDIVKSLGMTMTNLAIAPVLNTIQGVTLAARVDSPTRHPHHLQEIPKILLNVKGAPRAAHRLLPTPPLLWRAKPRGAQVPQESPVWSVSLTGVPAGPLPPSFWKVQIHGLAGDRQAGYCKTPPDPATAVPYPLHYPQTLSLHVKHSCGT